MTMDHAAATPGTTAMNHEAGCCGAMAMPQTAVAPASGSGCCGTAAMNRPAPAADHADHGTAPDASAFAMAGMAGCGSTTTTGKTDAGTPPAVERPSVPE